MNRGKWMRHTCGYRLWSYVQTVLSGKVMVNYRDGVRDEPGLIVSCCPGCGQGLQMWWDDPTGDVVRAWEQRFQRMIDEAVG
ncbi:hypothetical protein KDA_25440 [Dictyobacter alpinus]|uniref:Uncharacterized protein n=1 Tax=Dictyobacter alpinus TaxID=2014873 RepID=A0A402B6W9_9CHLR|nr:hypothetical protein [Dictyobacter alpinus]GCE27060.1 hypothetical protein KDA_25440 [Dictyobacter alpinus]